MQVIQVDADVNDPVAAAEETQAAESIQAQDAVVVDIVGRLAKNKKDEDGPIFQEAKDWLVVIGEKDVLPALEMGIRFMKVGQRAVVWSQSKFAYGPSSRKHKNANGEDEYTLPPDSSVRYEITVKSVASSDRIVNEPLFQIQVALSKKKIGNDAYLNEWSDGYGKARAKLLYKRAADTMQYLFQTLQDDGDGENDNDNDAVRKHAMEIMLDCLNNIAACHLRAKEFHQAKEAAVKVLSFDPDNLKGLVRAAKAALLDPASSYEEVEAAIAAAEMDHPDDSEVRKLRIELKQRKQAYKKKSKEMFSKSGKNEHEQPNKKESDPATATEEREPISAAGEIETQSAEVETEPAPLRWWRKNWRQWEWKNIILPYGFQLLLPFFTYWAFTVMKKQEAVILEAMRVEAMTQSSQPSPLDEFSSVQSSEL
jgi:tetratricopeptide (TPR) repeat protein